ncbi:MAG: hypothetical protein ACRDYX_09025 [Egibacteraceae bacterium]
MERRSDGRLVDTENMQRSQCCGFMPSEKFATEVLADRIDGATDWDIPLLISDRAVIDGSVDLNVSGAQLGDEQLVVHLFKVFAEAHSSGVRVGGEQPVTSAHDSSHIHRRSLCFPYCGDITVLVQYSASAGSSPPEYKTP